ncbi:ethanolamine ammonia-lyase subunit EutC [Klebsiella pneumoniae subsp. pneumoniae]|nr:ethanolamine ammonia-lyase subunit EutC [Klebsiella pneumoniae subsp. pneumoniae]
MNLPMRGSPWRSGASLPTREVLNFGLAHARARDAIHQPFASQQLVAPLAALGLEALTVHSAAPDRHTYLRRPDLGRQLADESRADLAASGVRPADLLLVIGDGLFLGGRAPGGAVDPRPAALSADAGYRPGAGGAGASVAGGAGDDIGETLKARAVAILIGERPGLSRRTASASTSPGSLIVSAWSLSATVSPIFGRRD